MSTTNAIPKVGFVSLGCSSDSQNIPSVLGVLLNKKPA